MGDNEGQFKFTTEVELLAFGWCNWRVTQSSSLRLYSIDFRQSISFFLMSTEISLGVFYWQGNIITQKLTRACIYAEN